MVIIKKTNDIKIDEEPADEHGRSEGAPAEGRGAFAPAHPVWAHKGAIHRESKGALRFNVPDV